MKIQTTKEILENNSTTELTDEGYIFDSKNPFEEWISIESLEKEIESMIGNVGNNMFAEELLARIKRGNI